jgi:hypothetical protein
MKNRIEKIRRRVADAGLKLSNAVYLPHGLIWFALFVAFSDLCVVLFAQPLVYWIGKGGAESSLPFLKSLLDAGVWVYVLAGLAYLLIVGLALTILTRSAALALWVPVATVHLSHSLRWLAEKLPYKEILPTADSVVNISNAVSALVCGFLLATILLRPARELLARRFVRWLRPVFSLAWASVLVGLLVFQAVSHHSGWQPIIPEQTPGKRSMSNGAYDSQREVFVMFGGIADWLGGSYQFTNDTWEWDGNDWKEIKTLTIPSQRAGQAMVYDEKREVVVMFGGQGADDITTLNDTWIYDGQDWKLMQSDYIPQARRNAQMFYDPSTGNIVLAGGYYRTEPDKTVIQLQDIWEWDGEKWSAARAGQQKITVYTATTTLDTVNNRVFTYNFDSMLQWANGQWTLLTYDPFPKPRWSAPIAADTVSGKILLFGGSADNITRNDTWVMEENTWRELRPALKPNGRESHLLFYDPKRGSFIVYGGWGEGDYLDDMWEYVIQE